MVGRGWGGGGVPDIQFVPEPLPLNYLLYGVGKGRSDLLPAVENPELTNVFPLKPGVEQNIATHASPTASNFFFVLISTFPVHSPSFSSKSFPNFLKLGSPSFPCRPVE